MALTQENLPAIVSLHVHDVPDVVPVNVQASQIWLLDNILPVGCIYFKVIRSCISIETFVWLAQPSRSTIQPQWPLCWPFWMSSCWYSVNAWSHFHIPATDSLPHISPSTTKLHLKKNRAIISLQSKWLQSSKVMVLQDVTSYTSKRFRINDTLMFINISNCNPEVEKIML